MHLFLSPHLDDAILSCGGLIHQLTIQGEPVTIQTFMAGDPPTALPDTPIIRDLHRRWEAGEHPVAARRQEDRAAAHVLGASVQHLDWLDLPYRTNLAGEALYPTENDLFGDIHMDDPVLNYDIELAPDVTAIYAPLGVGHHVDHQIVCYQAQQLETTAIVFYYEEYPYSASGGQAAVQTALAAFSKRLLPHLIELSEDDLLAKMEAIACYQSQISTFWDNVAEMKKRVRAYAEEVATPAAERLWKEERYS